MADPMSEDRRVTHPTLPGPRHPGDPVLAQLVALDGRARGRYAELRTDGMPIEEALQLTLREQADGQLPERRASGDHRRTLED